MKSFFYFLVKFNFWQAWLVPYHALFSDPNTVALNKFEASECIVAIVVLPIGVNESKILKSLKKLQALVPPTPAGISMGLKWTKCPIKQRLNTLIGARELLSRCLIPKDLAEDLKEEDIIDFGCLEIETLRHVWFDDDSPTPYERMCKILTRAWMEVKIKNLELPAHCPECNDLVLDLFTVDLKQGYLECADCKIDLPLKGKLPKTLAGLNKEIEAYEKDNDRVMIERIDHND